MKDQIRCLAQYLPSSRNLVDKKGISLRNVTFVQFPLICGSRRFCWIQNRFWIQNRISTWISHTNLRPSWARRVPLFLPPSLPSASSANLQIEALVILYKDVNEERADQ